MATKHGHVSVELLDKLGVTVSMPVYVAVDDTKTIAQALTDAQNIAVGIDAGSDSQVMAVSIKIVAGNPGGIKTSPAATAENERTGLFNFKQNTSPYKFGVDTPAIKEAAIVNGKINLSDAGVTALLGVLTAAGAALTPESTSLYTLIALLDALLTFRKHRKAESRRSFEVA